MIDALALLAQLRASIVRLAAPANAQKQWLASNHYPVDELAQIFLDQVGTFSVRLKHAGLINRRLEDALELLRQYLEDFLERGDQSNWSPDALTDQAEDWVRVRELAQMAVSILDAGAEVSDQELLAQLLSDLRVLATSSASRYRDREPIINLGLDIFRFDLTHEFLPRLKHGGLLSPASDEAMLSLVEALHDIVMNDPGAAWSDASATWQRARARANDVLDVLSRASG